MSSSSFGTPANQPRVQTNNIFELNRMGMPHAGVRFNQYYGALARDFVRHLAEWIVAHYDAPMANKIRYCGHLYYELVESVLISRVFQVDQRWESLVLTGLELFSKYDGDCMSPQQLLSYAATASMLNALINVSLQTPESREEAINIFKKDAQRSQRGGRGLVELWYRGADILWNRIVDAIWDMPATV